MLVVVLQCCETSKVNIICIKATKILAKFNIAMHSKSANLPNYPALRSWIRERKYFFPVTLNEQNALMGLTLLRKLLNGIRSSEFFSVIADEAGDIVVRNK